MGDFMNKKFLAFVLSITAGLSGCSKGAVRSGAADAKVAARVNGKDILRSDVEKYYNFKTGELPRKPTGEAETLARLEVVRNLIEREIMAQRAEQLKLAVTDAAVDAEMQKMKDGAPPEEFRKDLERRGFSEQDMRNELRRNLVVDKLAQEQINSRIKVTDAEVSKFFDENRESFNIRETQYRLGEILVSPNPSVPVANLRNDKALNADQAVKKIQKLNGLLLAGQDFAQVAREFSEDPQNARDGGDLGYQPAAALDRLGAPIKTAILKLRIGEVSPVMQTQEGFVILKLVGKRDPGQRDLKDTEVQASIRAEIQNRKQQVLSSAFTEELRNGTHVENFVSQEILAGFQK
jgi:parvulin-like peptidyl-prolyl isomerase